MGTDDFEFDDLFGDDDEDLGEGFELDDEDSGFGFDDEEDDYDLEDFDDFEDFEEEFDDDFLGEDEEFEDVGAAGGPSRTFVFIAMGMMVVFIVAIILVMVLVLGQDEGPSPNEMTAHAIETENAGTEMAFYATKTQEPLDMTSTAEEAARVIQLQMTEDAAQGTQDAEDTATAQFFADQTATAEAETPEVEITPTVDELARLQTAQAETAAAQASPEETAFVQPTISVDGVAATATAIAAALQTPIVVGTPTDIPEGGQFTPEPTATRRATALPDSGMFDDVGGETGVALMMLAAFGLIGIIFGTRTLRTVNRRR